MTIRKRKKQKDWFKVKKYPHIGLPLEGKSRSWVQAYVVDKAKVEAHSFLPFIHKVAKVRRFRKEISHDGTRSELRKPSEKKRELYYSSHLDSNIYSYYAEQISKEYEAKLKDLQVCECVTAYRRIPLDPSNSKSRNKCNVDFANDVFSYIKKSSANHLIAITFDIKSFFDTLDHKSLKRMWRMVIGSGVDLPPDHYNVYRNITKFSYVEEREVFNVFKGNILVEREPSSIKKKKIARRKFLKGKRAIAFCLQNEIADLRNKNYIKSNKYEIISSGKTILRKKGIPQGSPISSVLANVYMLDFDAQAKAFVGAEGIYRRYSDDMVVVCTPESENDVINFFETTIHKFELELQSTKTQVFHFIKNGNGNRFECKQKNLNTQKFQTNTTFEYLGFQFDGYHTLLKSSSLASYYRKMKRSIKRGYFYSVHNKTRTKGELFKNRLYKRFTHLGAHRRRIYQRDRNNSSHFILTHKYDWGNYLSYAYLAADVIPDNKIKRQVRKHWRKFHTILTVIKN
jgi:hypothetical protein